MNETGPCCEHDRPILLDLGHPPDRSFVKNENRKELPETGNIFRPGSAVPPITLAISPQSGRGFHGRGTGQGHNHHWGQSDALCRLHRADQGIRCGPPIPAASCQVRTKSRERVACKLNKASRHELLPLEGGKKALSSSTPFSERTIKQTSTSVLRIALETQHIDLPDAAVLVSVPITVPVEPAPHAHL
jgi:hypothetical protein